MQQKRFHIWFGAKRTTVSVDRVLFELMSIQLGAAPDEDDAHGMVRDWLQDILVSNLGDQDVRKSASQWARIYLIEAVADRALVRKRHDWALAGFE